MGRFSLCAFLSFQQRLDIFEDKNAAFRTAALPGPHQTAGPNCSGDRQRRPCKAPLGLDTGCPLCPSLPGPGHCPSFSTCLLRGSRGPQHGAPPTLAVLCPPWGGPAPSAHCRSESLHSSLLQPFPSRLLSHPTSPPETAGSHLSAITPWGHRTGGPRTPAGIRTPRVTGPSPGLPVLWVWGGARDSAFLSCP